MTNADKEFYRQFLASMVRKLFSIAGTYLALRGWVSSDQADGLTTASVVELFVSFLLIAGSTLWSWANKKFNVRVVREARSSSPETPIGVITTEALNKDTFSSSI